MDPHRLHLSSSAHTSKSITVLATKRPAPLHPFPSIKCGYHTGKELSPTKKRRVTSSPPSWSYFEVYGDVQEVMSTSDFTGYKLSSARLLHRSGSSRVLAAWEKLQAWSPFHLKQNARNRRRVRVSQSNLTGDDRAQSQPRSKPQSKARVRRQTGIHNLPSPETEQVGQSWDIPALRNTFVQESSMTIKSKRQVVEAAITQALDPSLYARKDGQGELALRMAKFLASFLSSAQTNETRLCEANVRRNLDLMFQRTEAAEIEVNALQSWLDTAEKQLHAAPSKSDIEHLESLLGSLHIGSREKKLCSTSSIKNQHGQPSKAGGSMQRQYDRFCQSTADLETELANMPTLKEVHELRQEFEETERELTRYGEASREAVNLLRLAIARGETSWLRNLESSAAHLESLACTVLPLESLYTTP